MFVCEQCGKIFATSSNKKRHIKTCSKKIEYKPFCRENMDYIFNNEQYDKKMQKVINSGIMGILQFVKWKYCDKDHPENRNIRLCKPQGDYESDDSDNTDESETTVEIFNGRKWIIKDKDEAMDMLLNRVADDLDSFIGYAKNNKIKLKLDAFMNNVAKPLGFDLMNIDVDEDEVDDDIKSSVHAQIYETIISQSST